MFLLCFCGMMIGLAIDLRNIAPQSIGFLCSATPSIASSVILHAKLLPATNLLMLASGFVAAGLTSARESGDGRTASAYAYLVCGLTMLAGMFAGEWAGPEIARACGIAWTVTSMTAAMTLGMMIGAAVRLVLRPLARA